MIICDVRLSPFAFNGFRFEMRLSAMVCIRVFLFGLCLLAISLSNLLIPPSKVLLIVSVGGFLHLKLF